MASVELRLYPTVVEGSGDRGFCFQPVMHGKGSWKSLCGPHFGSQKIPSVLFGTCFMWRTLVFPLFERLTLQRIYLEGCPEESGPARAAASRGLDHHGNAVQDTADRVMLFFLHLDVLDDVVKLYAKRFD